MGRWEHSIIQTHKLATTSERSAMTITEPNITVEFETGKDSILVTITDDGALRIITTKNGCVLMVKPKSSNSIEVHSHSTKLTNKAELKGTFQTVLYFENEEDREEFMAAIKHTKPPRMTARKL